MKTRISLDNSTLYPDSLKANEALTKYFEESGFSPSEYSSQWVRLPVGKMDVYLPNLKSRQRVIPLHDLDHVLTEYPTTWLGEFEISGYELGTGLGKYWFGWMVNLQGIWIGLLLYPRACFKAYVRGRRSGCLFTKYTHKDELLNELLGDIRRNLPVAPRNNDAKFTDLLSFGAVLGVSVLIHLPFLLASLFLIFRLINIFRG